MKYILSLQCTKQLNIMKGTLIVSEVKQVRGFLHENSMYAHPFQSNPRMVKHSYDPIALRISGTLDGEEVSFFSPTVIVSVTEGWLNYKTMEENEWFSLIEEETKGYRGAPMFDGGDTPNVAIQTKCEIVPKIKVGDQIEISYAVKGMYRNIKNINRVKVLSKKVGLN